MGKFKNILIKIFLLFLPLTILAQQKADHLIIITMDGFRWQEVFNGMDSPIANKTEFNQEDSIEIFKKYWNKNSEERRKLLLPFFWNTIALKGQIYGNRNYGNNVNTANPFRFSYPGYNEIFTGNPDTTINSNDFPPNPQINVLEYLNRQPEFKGRVAAFTAWEAFNRILNEGRSGIPVIAAFDTTKGNNLTLQQKLINKMLPDSYKPWGDGECLDLFTNYAAIEYLKTRKPKVLYIAYGETDEWAHAGHYRDYLNAAHQWDKWLQEIWDYVQSNAEYKNRTVLLITVDHGRGSNHEWTKHGRTINGAEAIWFAVVAPGVEAKGEIKTQMQLFQQQLAQTIASLLGKEFKANHNIADAIKVLK
jgi:hypothetical protein